MCLQSQNFNVSDRKNKVNGIYFRKAKGMSEAKYSYFQYQKSENLQVFIKVDVDEFDSALGGFLKAMRFDELGPDELASLEKRAGDEFTGNILTMRLAGSTVARQINQVNESDRYGLECITAKAGYKVYRFKDKALLVYSLGVGHWEMGCHYDFGHEKGLADYRSIINRYLSWALVSEGVVGFWGIPVEEGIVVLKNRESEGEAVFVNIREHKVYSADGCSSMKTRFSILRLDPTLKNKNLKMSKEELLGFLTVNTTFFDYQGLTVSIRQAVRSLAKVADGLVYSKESFKPRTDLFL